MKNEVNEYLEKNKPRMEEFFQQFEKQEIDTSTKAINTRNGDEILTDKYNKLRNWAQIRYSNDLEDELMSRYGGLDVNVYSEEYYLYNSLMRYVDDKEFFSKAVQLFYNDYPDYIETQIDYYDHVLYMIDHKDEYYKLANLYRLKVVSDGLIETAEDVIDSIEIKKSKLESELEKNIGQYDYFKNKKYKFWELISERKKDTDKMKNISNKIYELKKELDKTNETLDNNRVIYDKHIEERKGYNVEYDRISTGLERPFKDYTIDGEEDYECGYMKEYYMIESLNRLMEDEEWYRGKMMDLQEFKSYSNEEIRNRGTTKIIAERSFLWR